MSGDELRFRISSAAMSMLIYKATVQQSEGEGILFGEVEVHTSSIATDHDVATTEHRTVIVYETAVCPKGQNNRIISATGAFNKVAFKNLINKTDSSFKPVGIFRSRRNIEHKQTNQERWFLKNIVSDPIIDKLGTFFVKITTEAMPDFTRYTTQYQVAHISLSGRQKPLPFEVINLGDTSHAEYKVGSASSSRQLADCAGIFKEVNTQRAYTEINNVVSDLNDRLDRAVDKAKLSHSNLAKARKEFAKTHVVEKIPLPGSDAAKRVMDKSKGDGKEKQKDEGIDGWEHFSGEKGDHNDHDSDGWEKMDDETAAAAKSTSELQNKRSDQQDGGAGHKLHKRDHERGDGTSDALGAIDGGDHVTANGDMGLASSTALPKRTKPPSVSIHRNYELRDKNETSNTNSSIINQNQPVTSPRSGTGFGRGRRITPQTNGHLQ